MDSIYQHTFRVRYCDVTTGGTLRLSRLLAEWQETGMVQMEQFGQGNDVTLRRGLLWIISRQNLHITRLPGLDEEVILRTWPGEMRHGLFPRYYEVEARDGTLLVQASSQWSLLHWDSRTIELRPQDCGVSLPPAVTGRELPRSRSLRAVETDHTGAFTVPYSFLDLNGHMNNARYLDLAQDVLPRQTLPLRDLQIEYHHEILDGETLTWGWTQQPLENGTRFYFQGTIADQPCFRLQMDYGE